VIAESIYKKKESSKGESPKVEFSNDVRNKNMTMIKTKHRRKGFGY
jgi:hypothetical protein